MMLQTMRLRMNTKFGEASNDNARSKIIICLTDSAMAKTNYRVKNQEEIANMLWMELKSIYKSTLTQAIDNFQAKLKAMCFIEGHHYDKQVSDFISDSSEIDSHDQVQSGSKLVTKPFRTLPGGLRAYQFHLHWDGYVWQNCHCG